MSFRTLARASTLLLATGLLAGTPAVDFNQDDVVSLGEYVTVVDRIFAQADINRDRQVDRTESALLRTHERKADLLFKFALNDIDGDGFLSEDEVLAGSGFANGSVASGAPQPISSVSDLIAKAQADPRGLTISADENDSLTIAQTGDPDPKAAAELTQTYKQRHDDRMARIAKARVKAGYPAKIERPIDPATGRRKTRRALYDMDYDGVLTAEEYRSAKTIQFYVKDVNDDNELSRDEWPKRGLFTR